MIEGFNIPTVDEVEIRDKRVLVRVDYNVTLTPERTIADDLRIRQSIPTLKHLLKGNNKLILISHLGQPKGHDDTYSLAPIVNDLKRLLPETSVSLLADFSSPHAKQYLELQKPGEIVLLENVRFHKEEKEGDEDFAQQLSSLADVYVNDAFGVSHRSDTSIIQVPKYLPSFAGLLLKREVETIHQLFTDPVGPVVAIIGGAKISTKLTFLTALLDQIDILLLGGGLANTFLLAKGLNVAESYVQKDEVGHAREVLERAKRKSVEVILPKDAVVTLQGAFGTGKEDIVVSTTNIPEHMSIVDIGPQTQALFGSKIAQAGTILWNGPVGLVENPRFARGTDFLFYAIAQNDKAFSVVGGGDTIAAISKKEYIDRITWVSTGGGAMLELIEKGTLPGLEALVSHTPLS